MALAPLTRLRESFRAKLLVAMVGTVALLLLGTLLAVLAQTSAEVGRTMDQAVSRSREAFAELEGLRRVQLASLGNAFTNSRRTVALLEAALDDQDTEHLIQQVGYELALQQRGEADGVLTVFTDGVGEPVVSLLNSRELGELDPADVGPLARELLDEQLDELLAYRAVEDVLYVLRVLPLVLVGRTVGTVTFGLPLDDAAATTLGNVVGAEACFLAGERCLAGSPGARAHLADAMTGFGTMESRWEATVEGERWAFLAEGLPSAYGEKVWRVLALPLDPVVAPFERILWGLLFAGLGALTLALAVSYFLSRGLTRPVQAMVLATEQVAAGDYEVRVASTTQDELSLLASSFNAMTEGLQLKERYRGVLNKVVSPDVAHELMKGDVILGGETRQVTILFADICGFTPLTERMGPQEVIGLLNECMQRLSDAVEEMGGVVDKYVGDEIMAVFGAPLQQEDHARRAVMAGMRMLDAIEELNRERQERRETALEIRVGINTGLAVAGNMGSATRLNYTVLGEPVNMANRICQAAECGQVLISEGTRAEISHEMEVVEQGWRELKGFSKSVPLFAPRRPGAPGAAGTLLAIFLLAAAVLPGLLGAQTREGGLPTLQELGLGYLSQSGAVQLDFSGRFDLEGYLPGGDPPYLVSTADPFLAPRVQLFADLFVGERFYVFAELQADRSEEPTDGSFEGRLDQLFARIHPFPEKNFALQVGKFAPPFGSWAARHNDPSEPFIRPPLAYDFRTMICPFLAPSTAARFVGWREDPDTFRPRGAPPIWGVPYLWGGMVLGGVGRLNFQGAVLNGPVSSEPEAWTLSNPFGGPSYVAALNLQVSPELRLAGWYHRGPYMVEDAGGSFPPGKVYTDYVQELVGGEAVYSRGRGTLRGELIWDRWEVPNSADDPMDISYSAEGSYRLIPGLTGALRVSGVTFNELMAQVGEEWDPYSEEDTPVYGRRKWDFNSHRIQAAVAYRIRKNTGVKAEVALNRSQGSLDPDDDLFSLQWWWAF